MMTLRNMRENGVRSLAITCGAVWCNHQAVLDVNTFADDVVVPSFGPRALAPRFRFHPRQRVGVIARNAVS